MSGVAPSGPGAGIRIERVMIWLDGSAALMMTGGALWLRYTAQQAAAQAARLYGRSLDAAALQGLAAPAYFVPNAILSTIALLAMRQRWPGRWLIQLIAVFWLTVPVIWPSWLL